MGKQPTTGQKKSKDQISKAASQKKGGNKKWTKGKAKEKVENACFLDQATYDKLMAVIPKIGKHISISSIVEKYKIQSSLARILLRKLQEKGSLKRSQAHSRQGLYYSIVVEAEKPVEVKETVAKKEKATKKK